MVGSKVIRYPMLKNVRRPQSNSCNAKTESAKGDLFACARRKDPQQLSNSLQYRERAVGGDSNVLPSVRRQRRHVKAGRGTGPVL